MNPQLETQIAQEYAQGASMMTLAGKYGLSYYAVRRCIPTPRPNGRRRKDPPPHKTQGRRGRKTRDTRGYALLYEAGASLEEVAAQMNVSLQTARKHVKKHTHLRHTCRQCGRDYPAFDAAGYCSTECNRLYVREQSLKTLYGITLEEYDELYDKQKGKCLICEEEYERLHVDHDHNTGKVRGLLCRKCNVGIGMFGERVTSLQKAILYVSAP